MTRLLRLYLISRRAPLALIVIAASAMVLYAVVRWLPDVQPLIQTVGMITSLGAAAAIGATLWSPIGEVEQVAGGRLPALRTATTVFLLIAATLVLAVAGRHLPGGTLPLLRHLFGLTGITLISAVLLGARQCWVLPLAYTLVCARAFELSWTSLWVWPTRTAHDLAAASVATALLAVGLLITTLSPSTRWESARRLQ